MNKQQLAQLREDLADLRMDNPVLWSVVLGRATVPTIAIHLNESPTWIQQQLDGLVERKLVSCYSGKTYVPNKERTLHQLKADAMEFQTLILKKYPEVDGLLAMAAPAARKAAKAEIKEASSEAGVEKKNNLAPKQQELMGVAYQKFQHRPFTSLQLAQARGFDKAGFTKIALEGIAKKGYLEQVETGGRGSSWRITDKYLPF